MSRHPTLLARAVEDRRWTTVFLAMLCIGLLAWTFRDAVGGDLFRLHEIEVVGVSDELADLVRTYAAEPRGRYLWAIDERRVARRVALLPWARELRVTKQWPDSLRISLRSDKSVAQAIVDGHLVDVSSRGRMIATRRSASAAPLVQGAHNLADLKMAMAARRSFNRVRSPDELSELRVHALGVSLYDREGVEYRIGRERFEARLRKAERVRKGLKQRRVRVNRMILDDDMHPNRVVVRRAL